MITTLIMLIQIYQLVIFVSVLMSWFDFPPDFILVRMVEGCTEPVYRRIRGWFSFIPSGPFDWTPAICLILLATIHRGLIFFL